MPSSTESAHIRWLLAESKRLDAVITEGKRARKLKTEINKMIALYGEAEPEAGDVVNAVPNAEGKFHCPECNVALSSKPSVGAHLRRTHGIKGGLSGRLRPVA
jgi:hypothetical protein